VYSGVKVCSDGNTVSSPKEMFSVENSRKAITTIPCININPELQTTTDSNYCYSQTHWNAEALKVGLIATNIFVDSAITGIAGSTGVGMVIIPVALFTTGALSELGSLKVVETFEKWPNH
jgi:hypothetical protein